MMKCLSETPFSLMALLSYIVIASNGLFKEQKRIQSVGIS